MPITREIIIHATIRIHNRHVKLIQLGDKCHTYEDCETRGDDLVLETGIAPLDLDYLCIKRYNINLN